MMSEPPDFVELADRLAYAPGAPESFHPRFLVTTDEGLGWTSPSYAHMMDIPIVGEYLVAACVVQCAELDEKIKLPPNMKKLSESDNLAEYEEVYLAQYRTSAAILEYLRQKKFPDCPTTRKVLKNWKLTCDKLVLSPYFGKGWKLPAFFPLYSGACKEAIDEFFELKKVSHPHLAVRMEEHRQHAMEQHYAWEKSFLRETSPQLVPFPRCLWYQKYHTIYELNLPDVWKVLFGGLDKKSSIVDLTAGDP